MESSKEQPEHGRTHSFYEAYTERERNHEFVAGLPTPCTGLGFMMMPHLEIPAPCSNI
jgi:hypothetical protein